MPADVVERIQHFNADREPERRTIKYQKLRADPFAFLRGTSHLFYDRLAERPVLPPTPLAWTCGDLHVENFGSYKGDNRLVYFDINDFDDACLAPASWELVRFLASARVAAHAMRVGDADATRLCAQTLDAYADALGAAKPRWVERETALGLVRQLLDGLRNRRRVDLLDSRTIRKRRRRVLRCDGVHALPASDAQVRFATRVIDDFAARIGERGFFRVRDVARRVAGIGSLGVTRYVVLVEGKGSPDGNYLLDLKQAEPSGLAAHLRQVHQPAWANEAQRVVAIEHCMQAVSAAFLHPIQREGVSLVLRGLQPSADRVDLQRGLGRRSIKILLQEMARVLAWDQLRSAGRHGSATVDEWIAFIGGRRAWRRVLLEQARRCARQVVDDWSIYAAAYDKGAFGQPSTGMKALTRR